jgi:hypothetical protein
MRVLACSAVAEAAALSTELRRWDSETVSGATSSCFPMAAPARRSWSMTTTTGEKEAFRRRSSWMTSRAPSFEGARRKFRGEMATVNHRP